MSLAVIQPGLLSTIQDLGRRGFQKQGIVVGGVMDSYSARIANFLVGNFHDEALLDISMIGPTIRFTHNHLIAVTGADLTPLLNGSKMKSWAPVHVKAGSILSFDAFERGRYAYLAVSGGFDVPRVLGSRSTHLKAELGGFFGRALRAGDLLPAQPMEQWGEEKNWWMIFPEFIMPETTPVIRVLRGPEWDLIPGHDHFFLDDFILSSQSDRMGYRIQGESAVFSHNQEMISSAVTYGTIQIPPDGHPIILMADRQTTGGYPRIGHVITADLPKVAQVLPGKKIKFQEVSIRQAQEACVLLESKIKKIEGALRGKWGRHG
ncbi:MAG TPA: biotin-dependent carboxyltransferase family protein [Bacteriovoracaceae bacterium]|nr:biotin-dependent carboxyltransferase family protein [Bacteriovoracaceae bacterium]